MAAAAPSPPKEEEQCGKQGSAPSQQRRDRGILGRSNDAAAAYQQYQQQQLQPQVVDPASGKIMYFGAEAGGTYCGTVPVPAEYCSAWYPGDGGEYSATPNYYYPRYGRGHSRLSQQQQLPPVVSSDAGGSDNLANLMWMLRSEIVESRAELNENIKDVVDDVRELRQQIAKLRKALGVEGNCCPRCAAWMIRDQSVRTPSAFIADTGNGNSVPAAEANQKQPTKEISAAAATEAPKLERHDSWADEMDAEDAKLRENSKLTQAAEDSKQSSQQQSDDQEEKQQQQQPTDVIPGESNRSRRRRLRKQQPQQEGEEPPPLRLYPETHLLARQQPQPQSPSRFLVRRIDGEKSGSEPEDRQQQIFAWKTKPPFDPQTSARDMDLAQAVAAVMLESGWREMSTDEIATAIGESEKFGEEDRANLLRGLDKVLLWMCSISAAASIRSGTKWKLKISDVQHLRYNINMGYVAQ